MQYPRKIYFVDNGLLKGEGVNSITGVTREEKKLILSLISFR